MANLVNHLWRGVEEDKNQQHDGIGKNQAVRVCLGSHIERHEGNPQDEADADHIPEIMTETVKYVLNRQDAVEGDRLFNEAQRCTDEQGVDGSEQETTGHSQGSGDLLSKDEEEKKPDDGKDGDPSPQ